MTSRTSRWRGVSVTSGMGDDLRGRTGVRQPTAGSGARQEHPFPGRPFDLPLGQLSLRCRRNPRTGEMLDFLRRLKRTNRWPSHDLSPWQCEPYPGGDPRLVELDGELRGRE